MNVKALDRIFLAANISSELWIDRLGHKIKHQGFMSRHQFLESVVRCGATKYINANYPQPEKKLANATTRILQDLKDNVVIYDQFEFRKYFWNTKVSNYFKKKEDKIRTVLQRHIRANHILCPFLTLDNVSTIVASFGLSAQEIQKMWALSKQTHVEEYNEQAYTKYNRMRQVEFNEFIGRVAELNLPSSTPDPHELKKAIEEVMDEIFRQHDLPEDDEDDSSDESNDDSLDFDFN